MLHWPAASSSSISPTAERYVMHGEGPPVRSEEVEHAARLAIEVLVLWGGDVLCVAHFAAPTSVFVGDASHCDVALPAELLGAERRCVAVSSPGDVCAVVPVGARGWVTLPDGSTRPFDEPAAPLDRGPRQPTERLLPLPLGYRAHFCLANLEIQVATVRLGRKSRRSPGLDASLIASLGLSALTVASAMAVLSRLTPAAGVNHDERDESARVRLLRTYLTAATERAVEPRSDSRPEFSRPPAAKPASRRTAPPQPAPGGAEIETELGAEVEPTLTLLAIPMPAPDPIERRLQIRESRRFGIIGMLDWPELHDPKRKFERHLGADEVAMMQQLFNPESLSMDDGPDGLALSGTGLGGGGRASVIALGAVRTIDAGQGGGLDRYPGGKSVPDTRTSAAPSLRQLESIVSDPLAAASIRRAVHAERAALRGCYTPALAPSVTTMGAMVRFVVLGNGRFEQVRAAHPSLPEDVSRCIERVFLGLSVPNPVSRPVQVAYRVALDS